MVVRTQIYLPEDLHNRLKNRARIIRRSMAQQIREAVEHYLAGEDSPKPVPNDPIWNLPDHAVEGSPGSPVNIAARHDAYLYGWNTKRRGRTRKPRSRRSSRR